VREGGQIDLEKGEREIGDDMKQRATGGTLTLVATLRTRPWDVGYLPDQVRYLGAQNMFISGISLIGMNLK